MIQEANMDKLAYKKRYNNKRKFIQRQLSNRIGITMTFQKSIEWCAIEPPSLVHKKIKDEDKQAMKIIR